jgi:lipoate-protein ligase B
MLEEVMIKTLRDYKIKSRRDERYTGVWVEKEKIGFVGVRIVGGTTMHGFSLNVNNDFSPFKMIVPCGIQDVMITSISKLLKTNVDTKETTTLIIRNFADVFGVEMQTISLEEILEEIGANETPQLAQG